MAGVALHDCERSPAALWVAKRLTIIGVGLIGGSLARAVRAVCGEIIGCGRQRAHLDRAAQLGVIDRYESDIADAVRGADLVLVSVPLTAMPDVFQAMRGSLAPGAVVTDAGSAKLFVIDAARQAFGDVPPAFVPGHPIAGNEKSGVDASDGNLFRSHRVVLTPLPSTDPSALARVCALWTAAGAEVVEMEPHRHDEVLAATSHLPHLIAYALMDTLASMDSDGGLFRYAAGGLRDATRIAASDPDLWRDICLANREALLKVLRRFTAELTGLEEALLAADGRRLWTAFALARAARNRLSEVVPACAAQHRDPSEP
jgi:prephenate dehydrogenase